MANTTTKPPRPHPRRARGAVDGELPEALHPEGVVALSASWKPEASARALTVLAQRCSAGPGRAHRHVRHHQLMYAIAGVMRVITAHGVWVVPPQRAVWVPASVEHRVDAKRPFDLCTLYVAANHRPDLPGTCQVVAVPVLMRELLRRAATYGDNYPADGPHGRLLEVLLDQVNELNVLALTLPVPKDRRLRRIAECLQADPGIATTLDEWGREVGASRRTLERLFKEDTGMTFTTWRAQVRLLAALEGLSRGEAVTQVALAVGYEDVSSFIGMFKRALGTTPRQYFR